MQYIWYIARAKGATRGKGVRERGKARKNARRIFCGAAVGAANSLFGGGGGMLAVPLLQRTGLDGRSAHATAILVILPVSLLSFVVYAAKGLCEAAVMLPTAIGVTAGGVLGARLLGKLSMRAVNATFAALQLLAGAFLLFR